MKLPNDSLQTPNELDDVISKLSHLIDDNGEADSACTVGRIEESLNSVYMRLRSKKDDVFKDVPTITEELKREFDRLETSAQLVHQAEDTCKLLAQLIHVARKLSIDRYNELTRAAQLQAQFAAVNP